jgi:hypothetical protein
MTEAVERGWWPSAFRAKRNQIDSPPKVRRVWAQDVLVRSDRLRATLNAIKADAANNPHLTPGSEAIANEAGDRLRDASKAAKRESLKPRPVLNWWRGTLVEAAYQNLHAAEILMASLYDAHRVEAEIPEAIARVEVALNRDDPRRIDALGLKGKDGGDPVIRERFVKAVQVGLEATDAEHARLRSFRNAVVGSAVVLTGLLSLFIWWAGHHPEYVPECFRPTPGGDLVCATGASSPTQYDLLLVAALGALGGLLSAIVSIRNLYGTSLAYDVPTALAALKLPVGALSAAGGLLLVKAGFIPGLSNLDSQGQILAYAFLFGVAQQLFVGAVDRHAQQLLAAAPSKAATTAHPEQRP